MWLIRASHGLQLVIPTLLIIIICNEAESLTLQRRHPTTTSEHVVFAENLLCDKSSSSSSSSLSSSYPISTRKEFLFKSGFLFSTLGGMVLPSTKALAVEVSDDDDAILNTQLKSPPSIIEIVPCPRTGTIGSNNNNNNCISTASVRQLDHYMSPWSYSPKLSPEQVMDAIQNSIEKDGIGTILEQNDLAFRIQVLRNFGVVTTRDEIRLVLRPQDHVIIFSSQQIDGPAQPDFGGEYRKHLSDLRNRLELAGVVVLSESEFLASDDNIFNPSTTQQQPQPTEGVWGQLKAFYGLQSGQGFEDVFLEDD